MAWPDVRKRVFAYILNRLRLFTGVDPAKLEVSGSSLSLTDVEVDPTRIEVPGIRITRAILGTLKVQLSTQGVFLELENAQIEASVHQLEPELALSTILESTRTDIAAGVGDVGYGMGDVSGVVAKLADIALAQLSCRALRIRIRLVVDAVAFIVEVAEVNMNTQREVDVRNITVRFDTDSDLYPIQQRTDEEVEDSESEEAVASGPDSESLSKSGSESESDIMMSRSVMIGSRSVRFAPNVADSVYFDAEENNTAFGLDESGKNDITEFHDGNVASVDRLTFTYSVDPVVCMSIAISTLQLELLPSLRTLVEALNLMLADCGFDSDVLNTEGEGNLEIPSADSNAETQSNTEESERKLDMTVHTVIVRDGSRESVIQGVSLKLPTVSVDCLDVPGVLHVSSPMVLANVCAQGVSAELPLPLSITVPEENVSYAAELVAKVGSILAGLRTPPNPRPTPVQVALPELKLVVGSITILMFPESVTNSGVRLREVSVVACDGQVLLRDIGCYLEPGSGLALQFGTVRTVYTSGFHHALIGLASGLGWNSINDRPSSAQPFRHSIDISDLDVQAPDADIRIMGSISIANGHGKAQGTVKLQQGYLRFETCLEFHPNSFKVQVTDLFADLKIGEKTQTEKVGRSANISLQAPVSSQGMLRSLRSVSLPTFQVDISRAVVVLTQDESILKLSSVQNIHAESSVGSLKFAVPVLHASLVDADTDIGILRIRDSAVNVTIQPAPLDVNVAVGRVVIDCCADSYARTLALLAVFLPASAPPEFTVEPDESVDVLEGIFDDDSIGSNTQPEGCAVPIVDSQASSVSESLPKVTHSGALSFVDGYMTGRKARATDPEAEETKPHVVQTLGVISQGWEDGVTAMFRVTISRIRWQIYDGFDLELTRNAVAAAVDRIEGQASHLEPDSEQDGELDSESEDLPPLVGDLLYNSVFIGAPLGRAPAGQLRARVQRELGTASLERAPQPKLRVIVSNISLDSRQFNTSTEGPGSGVYSRTELQAGDVLAEDLVDTSKFGRLLERQLASSIEPMLKIRLETANQKAPEQRFRVHVQPLRLRLDQDTLEFATRFFTFKESSDSEQGPANISTFIQRAEILELPLKVDYYPKKVDYAGLRSGYAAELLNIFVLTEARVTLRHAVLHGITGYDRLFTELGRQWGPEIKANQLGGILAGWGPVRQALQLAVVPVREYGRDGAAVRRGARVFLRKTAGGLLRAAGGSAPAPKRSPNQ